MAKFRGPSQEQVRQAADRAERSPHASQPMGRPSIYSDALVTELCNRIMSGRTVDSVARDEDMPTKSTIYQWAHEKPDFSDNLARAREGRTESLAERMVELSTMAIDDPLMDPARIRAATDALDKAARLMSIKTHKIQITGKDDGPIRVDHALADEAKRKLFAFIAGGSGDEMDQQSQPE